MKKRFSAIYIIIIILVLALIGGGLYFLGTQKKSSKTSNPIPTPTPTNLVGNDKDEHGCIPSAGYSWCDLKQKCLRSWEEACENTSPTPTVDETATLKVVIKKALVAKHGSNANELNISVSKIEGNYAQGGAGGEGGGGMWFAAKVNGTWNLVWDGNGVILCSDLTNYPNFPSSMIPECFNDKTNKTVIR